MQSGGRYQVNTHTFLLLAPSVATSQTRINIRAVNTTLHRFPAHLSLRNMLQKHNYKRKIMGKSWIPQLQHTCLRIAFTKQVLVIHSNQSDAQQARGYPTGRPPPPENRGQHWAAGLARRRGHLGAPAVTTRSHWMLTRNLASLFPLLRRDLSDPGLISPSTVEPYHGECLF